MPEGVVTAVSMDWKTIASIATLLILYMGGTIYAVRHTATVVSNTVGQRITDLRDDIKSINTEIRSSNDRFRTHLVQMHSLDLKRQNGSLVYYLANDKGGN